LLTNTALYRLGGMTAIAGGVLRIANTFTVHLLGAETLGFVYLFTDVFLLFGLLGWYLSRLDKLGAAGIAGFVVAIVGILIVRSAYLFPGYGYLIGAMTLLVGLVIMNAPTLLRRDGARLSPVLWLLSCVSAIASLAFAPLAVVSAILFGAGFICAGIHLLHRPR